MKRTEYIAILLGVLLLLPGVVRGDDATNRLTFSARIGFNISARFNGVAGAAPLRAAPRLTPNGDPYNYDNGYVLTDVSGNFGGETWYWGYDSTAAQVSGNSISFNRSASSAAGNSGWLDSEPVP